MIRTSILLLACIAAGMVSLESEAQSKARITITRELDGNTKVESREFILEEGQDIDGLLREMGVMNEFGELKPGQRFEIQMEKRESGSPEMLNRLQIAPSPFPDGLTFTPGKRDRQAWLGVTVKDALVTGKNEKAARITEVAPGGPAEKAKLQEGDLITHIQKARVESASDVVMRIQSQTPGDELTIEFVRGGKKKRARVILEERVMESRGNRRQAPFPSQGMTPFFNQDGFILEEKAFLGITPAPEDGETKGVVVGSVLPGSCAEEAGLQAGDVILKFNGQAASDFDTLSDLVKSAAPGSQAELLIRRHGRERLLIGKLGSKQCSNREDFRIFHDYRGLDDEGQMLFDFEFDMDSEDLGIQFDELMRMLNDDLKTILDVPSQLENLQQISISIDVSVISPEELDQLNAMASPPVSAENDLVPEALSLFPNPGNGRLHVEVETGTTGDFRVMLYNSRGSVIFEENRQAFSGRYIREIDFSSYADGTYYLHVLQGGKSFARKVIKGR